MTEEGLASSLAQAIADALHEERPVLLKWDGQLEWEAVDRVNLGPSGASALEVRRASDGHTLIVPAQRVTALDVGVKERVEA